MSEISVLLEYTLKPTTDVEEVERRLHKLIEDIEATKLGVTYATYRRAGAERAYAHVATFPSEGSRESLTKHPDIASFIAFLGERTTDRPRMTHLARLATTRPA